jgi:3-methyl-2-oxobutanoate hydroxymethyltransferase
LNLLQFCEKKKNNEKLTILTCYEFTTAKLLAKEELDALLVGDSLAMVYHGFESTLSATVDMMAQHTAAVKRGAPDSLIISDMPFLSYRKGLAPAMEAAGLLMQQGATAVKLEGSRGNLELIEHMVDSGIPVMGHLGLTPQSYNVLGGNRVQGRDPEVAKKIKDQASDLEKAGCFSLVLECVPQDLAKEITAELTIPVIGIGAGNSCDGQVLVLPDMLGMLPDFSPRFVRRFTQGAQWVSQAVKEYINQVKAGDFPNEKESFQ